MGELKLLKFGSVNNKLLDSIDELRARVASGEVSGCIAIFETKTSYEFFRNGMLIEKSLALMARVQYKLNKEWDMS